MNQLAVELNNAINENAPSVFSSLSQLGKELFFPKGILSQSAEAGAKATKFNATIGIAIENGVPMHLPVVDKFFNNLEPNEVYTYAKPAGNPKLRTLWKQKLINDNPSLADKNFSEPVVTSALTHGLSIIADMFLDEGDLILSPDQIWGNYKLTFSVRRGAEIATYPMFKDNKGFDVESFEKVLAEKAKDHEKIVLMLNFPNNPTGYTPTLEEAKGIVEVIKKQAEKGTKLVTISDDAYFGLFFEDSIKESLFGLLANIHENVLAIKLDGPTKEHYAWGFRTGFITFGVTASNSADVYSALETKVKGIIRGTISNCNHASQSIIEKVLVDPEFSANVQEKFNLMKGRACKLKTILKTDLYKDDWDFYPFNSGYFMCLKLHKVNAEKLRVHLLDKYGVGTISTSPTDLRIAFSCIEEGDIQELVDIIHQGVKDLS